MTYTKRMERFIILSLVIHVVFFMAINLYLQGEKAPREHPLTVEFLPLPKPKERLLSKEPRVLSDASRRVEKETRQKEEPSSGISREAGIPKHFGGPPPTIPSQPAPLPRAPADEGERLLREPDLPKLKPPVQMPPREVAKELPKMEEAGPPKREVGTEPKVALPRVAEKEPVPEKREEQEQPRIAILPSLPEVGRAPSLGEAPPESIPGEEKRRMTARIPSPAVLPPLIKEGSKEKVIPPLSQLLPSQERLARLPSLKKEGTDAKVVKEETVSLNTQEFKYYSYFLKLKRKIENVWNYPSEAAAQGQQGQLFMEFSISKKGDLEQMKLINSSNYSILDEEALRAVRTALNSPMPFPEAWGLDRLNVRASFTYNLTFWTVQ